MMLRQAALAFPIDWTHRRPYSLASIAQPGEDEYFIGWDPGSGTYGEDWSTSPHDAAGVLIERSGKYHPIRIAQYALYLHARWLEHGDPAVRAQFLAQAGWLRSHQQPHDVRGTYRFAFPWPKYGAPEGWCSAMAQGEAISVLLRAQTFEPRGSYAEAARQAAAPFAADIAHGGVVWRGDGDVFLEEVVVDDPPHILNGCIYALWGLWELWRLEPEAWCGVTIEQTVATIKRWLPRFDLGWWTRYSLMPSRSGRPHIATLKYHAFHIAQMRVLAAMFHEPAFAAAADRWESYVRSPAIRLRVLAENAVSIPERLL